MSTGLAEAPCPEKGPGLQGRKGKQVEPSALPGLRRLSSRSGKIRATRAPRTEQPRGESFMKNPADSPPEKLRTLDKTHLQGWEQPLFPPAWMESSPFKGHCGRVLGSAQQWG